MKDNDRLFEMRQRAEKTFALINSMNAMFPSNPNENTILAIMASNYDSFWEGYGFNSEGSRKRIFTFMRDFCIRFYTSAYYDDMEKEINDFLAENYQTVKREI